MHKIARYSKVAFEIGRSVQTSSLEDISSKFFKLIPLHGIESALQAPEGSVVVLPTSGSTGYEKYKSILVKFEI